MEGVDAGDRVAMELYVEAAPEASGWSARLEFDPSLLTYVGGSFRAGDFIDGLIPQVGEKETRIDVGGVVLGGGATGSGDGFLGTLSFELSDAFTDSAQVTITRVSFNTIESGEVIEEVRNAVVISVASTVITVTEPASQRLLVWVLRGGQVFGTPSEFRVNSLVTFLVYRYQEDDLSDTTQITNFALSLPSNLGTVSGSRVRLNTVAGVTGAVRVTAGGLSTNYRITTMPSSIDHLEIRPADVRIASGTTIDFNARGVDRFGNTFTLSGVNVGWHVVPPELGTIQSRTGVLSATTPGVSGYVLAVVSGSLRFGDSAASGEGVSKVTVLGQIPQSFALLPNYPNPFNPETTIRFDLPTPALVDVSAYNLAGQRVGTLVRDQMPAGSHSVVWFAGEHPSGVYIIRLEAGELSETQKVLLAK